MAKWRIPSLLSLEIGLFKYKICFNIYFLMPWHHVGIHLIKWQNGLFHKLAAINRFQTIYRKAENNYFQPYEDAINI